MSKYNETKNITNKCADDKLHPKLKSNGELMCGCGTGKEFGYEPNLFDCRLFGLFLKKSENSHKKYKGLLQKLNILETAIFENKETGDKDEIQKKVTTIIDEFTDINLSSDTRQFIVEYMTDKSKNKDDFNRYQVMSTLQSTINFIEYVNNPKLADVIQAVSQWITESKKIIEGRSVSSSDISGIVGKQGEQVIRKASDKASTDIESGLLAKEKAEKPYPDTEEGNSDFDRHLTNITYLVNIAIAFSKISPEYFSLLLDDLEKKKKTFEAIRDENIYRRYFRPMMYNDDNNERPIFDIFRKLNEKVESINSSSQLTDNLKIVKDSLASMFKYYIDNVTDFQRHEKRLPFISYVYTYILLSNTITNDSDYKILYDDEKVGKKNDFITKKIVMQNTKRIIRGQLNAYRDNEKAGVIGLENENKLTPLLEEIFKNIEEQAKFEENDEVLKGLTEGNNGVEKYVRFEPPNLSSSD